MDKSQVNDFMSNDSINHEIEVSDECKQYHEFRIGALKSEFHINIHEKIANCLRPENDSYELSNKLDAMWRYRWSTIYRRGCSSPIFSRINKINNTLIIDCPLSMQPKYGFSNRASVFEDYIEPVSLDDHEWVYAQCHLPFYSEPTVRLHFHAQPFSNRKSVKKSKKANVVFIQFDALGRQGFYRRMPRSYQLLTSYRNDSSSFSLSELSGVEAIEFFHLNVNGFNSEPNMNRLYCGIGNCQTTSLLNLYKEAKYCTSFLESYSYQLWDHIPSHSVDRILAENYFQEFGGDTVELYQENSGCVSNTTWIVDEMLDYIRDRFVMMRQGGWFSINNIVDAHSEDELNNFSVMDTKFSHFLLQLNQSNALDNTILILLGDHGLHRHDWKELWREFDQRNPFLQILIGKNIKGSKNIIKHLKANRNKLVTHADIYLTFATFSTTSLSLIPSAAINLFKEYIPDSRTCQTAEIPDKWCNCWIPKSCPKF
ncbi:unnamed protein product [Adineta steineri]|uniref:Uncharacterized protein n=1 Tax=Adineta steineri TaxID=433720 RepID=A0A818KDX3_9BILA|nr:unnamed protein product [Adineta steineri]CAF3553705.1 unnamed protein product [Adineta steineri]